MQRERAGHSLSATRNASAGPARSSSTRPRVSTKYTGIMACARAFQRDDMLSRQHVGGTQDPREAQPCSTSSVRSRISAGVLPAGRALHGEGQGGVGGEDHLEAGVAGMARSGLAALLGADAADDDLADIVIPQPVMQRRAVLALGVERECTVLWNTAVGEIFSSFSVLTCPDASEKGLAGSSDTLWKTCSTGIALGRRGVDQALDLRHERGYSVSSQTDVAERNPGHR